MTKYYMVFALLILSKPFVWLIRQAPDRANAESAGAPLVLQALFLSSFVIVFYSFLRKPQRFLGVILQDKLLLILVLYVLLSALWSDSPGIVLQRASVFVAGTIFGLYLASQYSLRMLFLIVVATLGIAGVASAIASIALPELARDNTIGGNGAWLGIYMQKNELGRIVALGISAYWLVLQSPTKHKVLTWSVLLVLLALIPFTQSTTSLIVVIILAFLTRFWKVFRLRDSQLILMFIAAGTILLLLVGWILISQSELILQAVGRDPTRNTIVDRLTLWQDVYEQVLEKPLLGYGFNSFWQGWEGPSAAIWLRHGWGPRHAHNGYLDLLLSLGVFGLLLVLLHITLSLGAILRLISYERKTEALWPALLVSYLIVTNMTYSILVSQSVFFWTLYVATMASVKVHLRSLLWRKSRPVSPPQVMPPNSNPVSATY